MYGFGLVTYPTRPERHCGKGIGQSWRSPQDSRSSSDRMVNR